MDVVCNWVWIVLMCIGGEGALKQSIRVLGGSMNSSSLVGT